jgi:hypothetical protein
MTGSATSAAAAIKAFFMNFPSFSKNLTSVGGAGISTNSEGQYTHHN